MEIYNSLQLREVFHIYRLKTGSFLIAEPEKALVDSLYISAYKGKRYGRFPELHFPKTFSFKKVKEWINKIPSQTTREYVRKRLIDIHAISAVI